VIKVDLFDIGTLAEKYNGDMKIATPTLTPQVAPQTGLDEYGRSVPAPIVALAPIGCVSDATKVIMLIAKNIDIIPWDISNDKLHAKLAGVDIDVKPGDQSGFMVEFGNVGIGVIPDNTVPKFERSPDYTVTGSAANLLQESFVSFQKQRETALDAHKSYVNYAGRPGLLVFDNSPSID
jgi:hypothetical protein